MYRVRIYLFYFFFFSSRRRHTRCSRDWSSDVCSSDLFQDYLKYYGKTDLASNAQFYVGEIAYKQRNYQQAIAEYDKVLSNYPKSFKMAPALLHRGMALVELGQKSSGIRDLREVVRRFPGSEEDRYARAKLKELGVAISASR